MASVVREEAKEEPTSSSRLVRILQSIGAIIVTIGVLWFLFGIPAFLLFGSLFD